MHLQTQHLQQLRIEVAIPVLVIKTYMHGVNVRHHVFNRRAGELVKVLVLIGGMLICWDNAAAANGYTIDNEPTVSSINSNGCQVTMVNIVFVERVITMVIF